MSIVRRTLLAVLVTALVAVPVPAAGAERLEVIDADASGHPLVRVTVAAPGQLLGRELPADAFTVTENGEPVAVDITALTDESTDIVLLVDTSGSMEGAPIAAAADAARAFLDRLPASSRVAVVGFGTAPSVLAPFGTAGDAVGALAELDASGETALYDAVIAASGLFRADAARRAIVLLSDGGDTASGAGLPQAVERLRTSGTALDAIALETNESAPAALGALAGATGGRVARTDEPAALTELFSDAAARLVNRYAITYRSTSGGATQLAISLVADGEEFATTHTVMLPFGAAVAAEDEPRLPALEPQTVAAPLLSGPVALALGGAAVFLALATLGTLAAWRPRRSSLSLRGRVPTQLPAQLVDVVQERLDRQGSSDLDTRLDAAGLAIRPAEWVVGTLLASFGVLAVAVVGLGPIPGLLIALTVPLLARAYLSARAERRRDDFASQLADTLQLLSGSLRAGYGVLQAIEALVRESQGTIAEEFRRVLVESRLGRDLDESLQALAARMHLEDLDWVVQAIEIHRDVGGDLAEILDAVAATVRERDEIKGKVRALSAEGRLSAWILLALPFVMVGALQVMQPGYLAELTEHPVGWMMIAVGGSLMTVGGIWIRRLVRPVY